MFDRTKGLMSRVFRLRRKGAEFAADERGVTALEFGLVSIPFFGILFAIFESAFLVFNQGNLEHATYEASRQLLTGSIQSNGQTAAQQLTTFQNTVCAKLWANFTCSKVKIDVRSAANFTGTFNTTNDFFSNGQPAVFTPGASGNVIVVRVGYPYNLYFSYLGGMGNGTKTIMATSVFKSENY